MYLRNGLMCVVDLGTGATSSTDLPDELTEDQSAIAVSERLHESHPDSLILGTGPLTGSLVPAACAGVASRSSPDSFEAMPVLGSAGVELKLSGFDFVIVKGVSASPCYLWIRDGIAELVPAQDMAKMDSWQRTEKIRVDQGDRKIQVLSTGPWGDSSRKASSLVVNHWLGEDEVGIGSTLGDKRLVAIAFRGMGELEVSDPDAHWEACLSLRGEHAQRLGPSAGLESYTDISADREFASLVHRVVGCFGCPHPCRSFLKTAEDPRTMALAHKEPGYLHFDIPSILEAIAAGMSARDATVAMMECAKHGADAASVLRESGADMGRLRSSLSSMQGISRLDRSSLKGSFSACADYRRTLALGLCPRYWDKVGFDAESVAGCAESALGRPVQ